MIRIHEKVKASAQYNFIGCKIPLNNRIDTEFMKTMLHDYNDKTVCELLKYGFPIGVVEYNDKLENILPVWKYYNHRGANEYPEAMLNYLLKEKSYNAVLGPFKSNPFSSKLKISPLNSVPKKDVSDRRIFLDLSFPKGSALNDFINKSEYLGESINLVFPKIDDMCELIKAKGNGCLLFKKDLKRAFRQISICPGDYNLVSFIYKKHIFCDTVLSMGLRSAAYICQRVTNAVAYILLTLGVIVLNYLDDFAGAEKVQYAEFAYLC